MSERQTEMDRLDLQHHAFRLTLDGKLFRAPIPDNVQNVLDVGCGTGIWSIEFADEHPSARVLGTDLSPIQPAQVPPNCEFLIDDCEQEWIFHNQFDYIHTRAMVAAVKDWSRFFEQSRRLPRVSRTRLPNSMHGPRRHGGELTAHALVAAFS
jgi:ubiquinone/menaquinone biosynthesis C-methylase UbiE